jgi:translocation and assembly module TamB
MTSDPHLSRLYAAIWKPLRILLYAVVAIGVLAAGAIGALSTPWFHRWLERRIVTGLEEATGGHVEIGELQFSPSILQIVLQDPVLHGSERAGEPALLSARTVAVRLSLLHLLHRHILLRRLDVESGVLHLRTYPDGSTNLPVPAVRRQPAQVLGQITDLAIRNVTLAHSSLYWNDQQWPLDITGREVALLLSFSRGGGYQGTLTSSATTIQSSRWSPPPFTFTSRFELSRRELAVTSLAWQARGMQGQGSFTLRAAPTPEAQFAFQATAEIPDLARAIRIPALQGGSLRVNGAGAFRNGEISAQGHAQVRQLLLAGPPIAPGRFDTSANFHVKGGHIELLNLAASGLGGTALGKADIQAEDSIPHFRVDAQLRSLELAMALRSVSPAPLLFSYLRPSSKIDGIVSAEWAGGLDNFESRFNLTFRAPDTVPPGWLPIDGKARGTLRLAHGMSLELLEASFRSPASSFQAHGELNGLEAASAAAKALVVDGATTDFEELRPVVEYLLGATQPLPLSLKSSATFSGEITGAMARPQVQGRIAIGEFEYHGWTWDSLTAQVMTAPNFTRISSGRLQHQMSSLSVEASAELKDWRLTTDSPARFSARTQRAPLDGLKAALGLDYPISGIITGGLDLEGPVGKLAGMGRFRIEKGELARQPFDTLTANIRVTDSVWSLDGIDLAEGPGHVTGQISLEPSKRYYTAKLQGAGLSLAEFGRFASLAAPSARTPSLTGRVGFDLQGEGTPEDFQYHATWTVEALSVEGSVVGDLRAHLQGQGARFHVQGEGAGPAGNLQFSGECGPGVNWPLEIHGQYTDLRLDPLIRLLDSKFGAQVTAVGSFELAGPLRDPAKLALRSRAQALQVNLSSLQWKNDQPVDLNYASGVLTARRFRMKGSMTDLEVEGSIRFAQPATLSLSAQGTADAALLSILEPGLVATGRSELKLRLTGTPSRPLMNGTIDVQDVGLSIGDLPFRLSSLNGTLQLEGEKVTVSTLQGVSGGGAVRVGGSATLAETPRFNLQAKLEQIRASYPAGFTSVLNGNLQLTGTPERGQLQGELSLSQIFATENVNWVARLIEAGSLFEERPSSASPPAASKIQVNVHVASVPPVRLETRDMRLVADVDLRVQGTLTDHAMVGTVNFLSGEAVFRGNRYKLSRGAISLTNPFRIQPQLDLEAQTRVQRYDLTLDISGPLDRLKFAYRSDPPLPAADILSLLALGYAHEQEGLSMGRGNPSTSLGATALLSEALSSQVTGRIQRLFGVSRIKIDPNVGAPGYGSGARVTVEQQLTPDLTLTYVTNTAQSQYRIIQFEWTLSDKLSLIGVRDPNGIFGIEVMFRHRFR